MIIVLPSCFQNVFRPDKNVKPAFSLNSPRLKSFSEKFRFRSVWTVGLTVEKSSSGVVRKQLKLYFFFILNIIRSINKLRYNEPQTKCFIYKLIINSVNLMAYVLKLRNAQHAGPKYVTLY